MTDSAPAQTIGAHPLTGKLVGALRHIGGGLSFPQAELEQFREAGSRLTPNELITWIRDLGTLAITLRNDIMAAGAATQIEQGLIDPLCKVLEEHVRATQARSNGVEELVRAERRKLEKPNGPAAAIAPKSASTVGAYLRTRRKKDQ